MKNERIAEKYTLQNLQFGYFSGGYHFFHRCILLCGQSRDPLSGSAAGAADPICSPYGCRRNIDKDRFCDCIMQQPRPSDPVGGFQDQVGKNNLPLGVRVQSSREEPSSPTRRATRAPP